MDYYSLDERIISSKNHKEMKAVEEFLNNRGLLLDKDIEYTMAVVEDEKIVATGSLSGRILKCIAVEQKYQGMGMSNRVISHLVNEAYHRGNTHLFIYTKPENATLFRDLGFYKIAEIPSQVILLENKPNGIKNYLEELMKKKRKGDKVASIVVNCNPFTRGHQFLIEKAAKENDILHVFVVWENKSVFPSDVRYRLVEEGTNHLSNIILHKGRDYIISNATFPSYFIKENKEVVKTHALLDLKIFSTYIAKALGINRRYVGEEPYCELTKTYNGIMKEILPKYGIEVVEVPRLSIEDRGISASLVRKYIEQQELSKIENLVPKTTLDFLFSEEATPIIKKIMNNKKS